MFRSTFFKKSAQAAAIGAGHLATFTAFGTMLYGAATNMERMKKDLETKNPNHSAKFIFTSSIGTGHWELSPKIDKDYSTPSNRK